MEYLFRQWKIRIVCEFVFFYDIYPVCDKCNAGMEIIDSIAY